MKIGPIDYILKQNNLFNFLKTFEKANSHFIPGKFSSSYNQSHFMPIKTIKQKRVLLKKSLTKRNKNKTIITSIFYLSFL